MQRGRRRRIRNQDPAQIFSANLQNYTHLWIALYKYFLKLRGRDLTTPGTTHYPATTNADVLQTARLWTKEVDKAATDDETDRIRKGDWNAMLLELDRKMLGKPKETLYAANRDYWVLTNKTAIWLDTRKLRPSQWELISESVKEAVSQDLPRTIGAVGSGTKGAAQEVASWFSGPVKWAVLLVGAAIVVPPVIRALRD